MMKKSLLLSASFFCLLGLGACTFQDIYGPSARPRGYAHYNDEFRTIVPERPFFVGEEYTDEDVAESERLWTIAVNDLLNQLEDNAIFDGLSISLQPTKPGDSFEVRMDYYLRKALKERGYLIVTEPLETIPVLKYYATPPNLWLGLEQAGRFIDDMGAPVNVYEYMKSEDPPKITLGINVYDLSAKKTERLLLTVETAQQLHPKDVREVMDSFIEPPNVEGYSPTSFMNK